MATSDKDPRKAANEERTVPHRGDILVAQPLLPEPIFSRAVVLLVEVDDPDRHLGSMGLVMNKKIDTLTMADVIPGWSKGKDIPVYLGGPVDHERLFMIHTLGARFGNSVEISPNLYIGGNINMVVDYVESGGNIDGKVRFFIGYSGWAQGQLENELKQLDWALTPKIDIDTLLRGSGLKYWQREVECLGESYRHWLLIPENPEWN